MEIINSLYENDQKEIYNFDSEINNTKLKFTIIFLLKICQKE